MRRIGLALLVTASLAAAASCSADTPTAQETEAATGGATEAAGGGGTLVATLTGAAEVPGPGAEDATGEASIDLSDTEVCFELTVEGLDDASAAHIHQGAEDEAGEVVVPLEAPASGESSGCAEADPELVAEIAADPEAFYVNVHNEEFPDGAVRGQLAAS